MELSASAAIFSFFLIAHLATRLWPSRIKRRPLRDMRTFLFEFATGTLIVMFYGVIPFVALFTPYLSQFDYSAPAFFHWLSIPVFADSVWTFWLYHTGYSAASAELRGRYAVTQNPRLAALWIWTVGQSLCVPNCIGGVGSLAAFGLLCLIKAFRHEKPPPPPSHIKVAGEYMNRTKRTVAQIASH